MQVGDEPAHATETAWKVCEPTSIQHEQPSRKLVQMAGKLEMVRGSRIVCYVWGDLLRQVDATGRKRWLMQADEMLYLHPNRVRLTGPAIDVDRDPLPDVVLEVDHTTDVRRRTLGIYLEQLAGGGSLRGVSFGPSARCGRDARAPRKGFRAQARVRRPRRLASGDARRPAWFEPSGAGEMYNAPQSYKRRARRRYPPTCILRFNPSSRRRPLHGARATGNHRSGGDMSTASFDVSGDESSTDRIRGPAAYRDEDFPGCESFHLPACEIDHYEGRLEFWDGATETAWKVCEPLGRALARAPVGGGFPAPPFRLRGGFTVPP